MEPIKEEPKISHESKEEEPYMTNSSSNSQIVNETNNDSTTSVAATCFGFSFTCTKIKKSNKKSTPKKKVRSIRDSMKK